MTERYYETLSIERKEKCGQHGNSIGDQDHERVVKMFEQNAKMLNL